MLAETNIIDCRGSPAFGGVIDIYDIFSALYLHLFYNLIGNDLYVGGNMKQISRSGSTALE